MATIPLLLAPFAAHAGDAELVQSASPDLLPLAEPLPWLAWLLLSLVFIIASLWVMNRRAGRASDDVRQLRMLFDCLDEGIIICSGMQIVSANTSFCRLIGIDSDVQQELMLTALLRDADTIERLLSDDGVSMTTWIHPIEEAPFAVEISGRSIDYAGETHRLFEIRDMRQQQEIEQRIAFLAHYDALTSLPNREEFRARLEVAIQRARAKEERCAAIWVDLDDFKQINDVHGHAAGDLLLRTVAEKLRYELPAGTTIARFGADEFAVLCEEIIDPREARLIGQQLRRMINRPMVVGSQELTVAASIGVAVFPDDAGSADELLTCSDLALFQAKASGRGRCRVYSQDLARERQRHDKLCADLPRAVANGDIVAHFQPLVRGSDLRIAGFETLARWTHPDFGSVPPNEFVRLSEEIGLGGTLSDVMIRQGIAAAQRWPESVRIAVNVSPAQIGSGLVDRVRDLIKSCAFDPSRLELEVTEDVLIKDFDQTASVFARLRALGVQVAMDDFGAGFTSLGNLRRLNFERIKIDRIFTTDLPSHRRTTAIVRSMFVLARELDLGITVEGVENVAQFSFLRSLGPLEIQGFLFSKPKPLSEWSDIHSLQFASPAEASAGPGATLIEIGSRRTRRAS